MTNVVTLDSLREAVQRKYAPVAVQLSDGAEVVLRGILRLTKDERDKVTDSFGLVEALDDDQTFEDLSEADRKELVDSVSEVLLLLAESRGSRLVSELGGDLPMLMQVLEAWVEASQPGEAAP